MLAIETWAAEPAGQLARADGSPRVLGEESRMSAARVTAGASDSRRSALVRRLAMAVWPVIAVSPSSSPLAPAAIDGQQDGLRTAY